MRDMLELLPVAALRLIINRNVFETTTLCSAESVHNVVYGRIPGPSMVCVFPEKPAVYGRIGQVADGECVRARSGSESSPSG
jgi:hypothetical protein